MNAELLFAEFERLSEAPGAVNQFRRMVIALGLRGALTSRENGTAASIAAIHDGMRALLNERPRYRWVPTPPDGRPAHDTPVGWCVARLGDTAAYVNGVAFKPSDWSQTGRPIIRIQNLSRMSGDYNLTTRDVGPDNVVAQGDILVSWSATLDTFIWDGPEAVLNQHIFKVIANDAAVCPRFLYWLLKHEVRTLADSQHAHGLAMMHINRGPFLEHPVAIPPRLEQAQIAAKIDEMMVFADELETAHSERERGRAHLKKTTLRLLSLGHGQAPDAPGPATEVVIRGTQRVLSRPGDVAHLREAIRALAVRGQLVPQDMTDSPGQSSSTSSQDDDRLDMALPAGWGWGKVHQVADARLGKMLDKARNSGRPYRYLRNTNVHWFDIRVDDLKTLPLEDHEVDQYLLRDGDVVICEGGHGIGRAAVWRSSESHIVFQKALHRVRPGPDLVSDFFAYCIAVYFAEGVLQRYFTGVGIPHFTGKALASLVFPLPPAAEQRRIVAKVDELMAICDEFERSLTAVEIGRARALDAVLAEVLDEGGSQGAVDRTAA